MDRLRKSPGRRSACFWELSPTTSYKYTLCATLHWKREHVFHEESRHSRDRSRSQDTSPDNAASFNRRYARISFVTPGNFNYFASTFSCTFALCTAALTAARNDSVLAGAWTPPDSVLRNETFLP